MTVSLISPARGQTFTYDANGNLVNKDHGTQTSTYTYDELDRLITEIRDFSPLQDYSYDPNGNRTALTIDGVTDPYNYTAYTNQLEATFAGQYTYDTAGNILSDPSGRTFEYDDAGRLAKAYVDGSLVATYTYNAQNQRIRKETPTETTLYHYDLTGNLISETDPTGTVLKAYLWHDGQPVAQIAATGAETVAYLHTDHLQTPRQASDQNGKVIWRWDDVDAFGATSADDDPDEDGTVVKVNLRFPGQYFDGETGLYYNWNRYYDPEKGRYTTSDPIGLRGGLNTFGYVNSNPKTFADANGLALMGPGCSGDARGMSCGGGVGGIAITPISVGGGFSTTPTLETMLTGLIRSCKRNLLRALGVAAGSLLSSEACGDDNNCKDDRDCERIQREIDAKIAELKRRVDQALIDKHDLYATRMTGPLRTWEGHKWWYENRAQVELRELIAEAIEKGCSYNVEADEWANKPFPEYPHYRLLFK